MITIDQVYSSFFLCVIWTNWLLVPAKWHKLKWQQEYFGLTKINRLHLWTIHSLGFNGASSNFFQLLFQIRCCLHVKILLYLLWHCFDNYHCLLAIYVCMPFYLSCILNTNTNTWWRKTQHTSMCLLFKNPFDWYKKLQLMPCKKIWAKQWGLCHLDPKKIIWLEAARCIGEMTISLLFIQVNSNQGCCLFSF